MEGFKLPSLSPMTMFLVHLNDIISIEAQTNSSATIELYDNGNLLTNVSASTILQYNLSVNSTGDHDIVMVAHDGTTTLYDTISYAVIPPTNFQDPPIGMLDGINYINDSTVTIKFFARKKHRQSHWRPQ